MKKLFVVVLLILAVMSLAACSSQKDAGTDKGSSGQSASSLPKRNIRLVNAMPVNHYMQTGVKAFADIVEKETDGRIKVQSFPASQLIAEKEQITSISAGSVEMSLSSTSEWFEYKIPMPVLSLPFAISGIEQARKFRGGEFEKLLAKEMESVEKIKVLGFMEAGGAEMLASNKKVFKTLEDFKGIKLRSNNKETGDVMAKSGAQIVSLPSSEIYEGLMQGTIDAAISVTPSVLSRKWYEAGKYLTKMPGWAGYIMFSIQANRDWWDKLTPEEQAIINKGVQAMVKAGQDGYEASANEGYQKFKSDSKIEYYEVPLSEQPKWAAAGQFVADSFFEKWGDRGRKLYEALTAGK